MSEFARKREFRTLDDILEAIDRDTAIGYTCRSDDGVIAFGDVFLGDTGIFYARETDAGVETHEIVLYHNQEPALVAWLLATVAQGMTPEDRAAFHEELMTQIACAETEVKPPAYHHETFGTTYWGEESARLLRLACTEPDRHPATHWWHDAATMDDSRPSIRTDILASTKQVRITDEFEESSFEISYTDAVNIAIGLTVYDRGRIRPEVIKQVYDGL